MPTLYRRKATLPVYNAVSEGGSRDRRFHVTQNIAWVKSR
jgi:hypothetical protein